MIILSFIVHLIAAMSCGNLLARAAPKARVTVAEQLVLGMGMLGIATFFLAIPGLFSLRLISLALMITSMSLWLALSLGTWTKGISAFHARGYGKQILIAGVIFLPLGGTLFTVPLYLSDELGHWAVIVKEMVAYDDLPRMGHQSASQFGTYPILAALISVNSLSVYGSMHEGIGRVTMFVISAMGSLFFFEFLRRRFSTAISVVVAAMAYALVLLPSINWYASWLPEGIYAVLILLASCRVVVAFASQDAPDWPAIGVASLLLMMLVFVRPDGITFLPLYLAMGVVLIIAIRTAVPTKLVRLMVLFVPPMVIMQAWSTYASINQLPDVGNLLGNLLQRHLFAQPNDPASVFTGIGDALVQTDQLVPMLLGTVAACILAVSCFRHLDWTERALLLLLAAPLYRLVTLFGVYLLRFSPYEAAQAAGFGRYMLETSYAVFLVLGVLVAKLLSEKSSVTTLRRAAYASGVVVVVMHLSFAYLVSGTVVRADNRRVSEAINRLKEEGMARNPIQVVCQECPGQLPLLVSYYGTPEILVRGPFTLGRPVSSNYVINAKRDATRIQTLEEYELFMQDLGIQGVLILESDEELERILRMDLDPPRMRLFTMRDGVVEEAWSTEPVVLQAPEGPSLRAGLKTFLADWTSAF